MRAAVLSSSKIEVDFLFKMCYNIMLKYKKNGKYI